MTCSHWTVQPKFGEHCLTFILGASGSGKSNFIKHILLEREYHFEPSKIETIVYVYSSVDEHLDALKKEIPGIHLVKELPQDWKTKWARPGSIIVFDDQETKFNSSKSYSDQMNELATIFVHHLKL